MKKHLFLPLLLLLLPLGTIRAQVYIGAHGGVTLPTGFYADSKLCDLEWIFLNPGHQKKVGAGTGFFGGLDVAYAMPFAKGLSLQITGEYMQSGFGKDVRDYLDREIEEGTAAHETYEMVCPQMRNIPVMAGLRYSYPLGVYYDLYGEVMGGVNFRSITDWKIFSSDENLSVEEVWQYDQAKTIAFRLGVGVVVRDIVTLGASYTMLGKSTLRYDYSRIDTRTTAAGTQHYNYDSPFDDEHYTFNPSMVMITLGLRFSPTRSMTRTVQDY